MAISCLPQDLITAANCFFCVKPSARPAVKNYILCQWANNMLAAPTSFTFLPSDTTGNTVVASWDGIPTAATATEVWTSTDNITYVLSATVLAPGKTASLGYGGAGVKNWCKVRFISATAQGTFSAPIFIPGEVPVWIKAVITNGGAAVAQATCLAMNTFAIALVNGGIDTLMQAVNCIVPDNLTAALTPLYKTQGSDPWTNVAFVGGDLSVNGLVGNTTTKILDTGVVSTTAWQNTAGNINANTSGGISMYNSTAGSVNTGVDWGAAGNLVSAEITATVCYNFGADNHCFFDFSNNSTDRATALNAGFKGFTSFNRTGPSASAIYQASSSVPFATLATQNANTSGHAMPVVSFCCFGNKSSTGVRQPNSDRTYSFAALHIGLSSAQAQTLFNAVQALRTALGGGFV